MSSALACTAILNPRDDVQRCGSATDCDASVDERYVMECRFDPANIDLDTSRTEKVCVPEFRIVGCEPVMGLPPTHALRVEFEARAKSTTYTACSETPGVQGCPAGEDGCADGLQLVEIADGVRVCDDDDPNTPPAYANAPAVGFADEANSLIGQDILDQYCRGFFCEDEWVCDKSTDTCKPCDPELPFGQGGCGEVYIGGEPSCAYLSGDALEARCAGPDAALDDYVAGCSES
jgi:hypothetical protein